MLALIKHGMLSQTNFFCLKEFDEMIDIMMEQKVIYVAWNFRMQKSLL